MEISRKLKLFLVTLSSLYTMQLNAASIGTYSFADNAIADQLISAQGQLYNGTNWYFASGNSWLSTSEGTWQASNTPTDTTDNSVSSFLAAINSTGTAQLEYGFSQSSVVNGSGSDLAFFFLLPQSNNNAVVSINGLNQELSFINVFNEQGIQQVANDIIWNGAIKTNLPLVVGLVDLSNFGLALDESLSSSIVISMQSNNETEPMALSLIAALNSSSGLTTPVPVPAAFVLFLSGLTMYGLFFRRKKAA